MSGSGATSGSDTSGVGGTGGGSTSSGWGPGPYPSDGATTDCQLLASIGLGSRACNLCLRHVTGEDGVGFASCSDVGQACLLDTGCSGIFLCLSEHDYVPASLATCYEASTDGARAMFKAVLDCALPWCGAPDQCAYSGETPGCTIDDDAP